MTDSDPSERADEYCRALAARHYENFAVTSAFVSPRIRLDLARIYAYCRTTDDFGDESGAAARPRLLRWREQVEELFAGGEPTHPVLVALRETIARCRIGSAPFFDLIRANLQDQEVSKYEAWADLREYCTWSAAPVGRMVLAVFGMGGPVAEQLSDDVCIGLQLANFAQDVSVDEGKGRCYLVQSELRELGVAGAVRAHCERARRLLASGKELEATATLALRLQLSLYRLGGLAICSAIARAGYRTDSVRPIVSKSTKALLLARALFELAQRRTHGRRPQPA